MILENAALKKKYDICQHCNESGRTVDHLATRYEKMLDHDYTRRHNEVVGYLYLLFRNKFKLNSSKRIRIYSLSLDTRIKTDFKICNNKPIYSLQIVETEKLRNVETISYVMTWDGFVTKYH
ncbi:hypothetical protein CWI38_2610p0010, partial [Hamiltosporidium tvaerminnensis]